MSNNIMNNIKLKKKHNLLSIRENTHCKRIIYSYTIYISKRRLYYKRRLNF